MPAEVLRTTEKDRNQLTILKHLIQNHRASATEISQQTGISAATVSRAFKDLLNKNLIKFCGKEKTEKGRNPDLYSFNYEYGYLLHYYLTSDTIYAYLADLSGQILGKEKHKYSSRNDLDDFFTIIKKIQEALSDIIRLKKQKILAAGFSIPGVINDKTQTVYIIPDVYKLNNVKFIDYAERVLGVPVIANNISWLSAVGEKAQTYPFTDSLAYIVFSNPAGIGVGIIQNNKLIKGGMNYAGELGQMWDNPATSYQDYFQGNGRFENHADLNYLFDKVSHNLSQGKAPVLKKLMVENQEAKPTLDLLEQAAKKGDSDVKAIIDDIVQAWARMIINLNLLLNPEIIVIGGHISVRHQYIRGRLEKIINKAPLFQPNVQFSVSSENAQLYGGIQLLKDFVNKHIIYKEAVR